MPSTRRRKKAATPKIGKESWQVVGEAGEVLKETPYGEKSAVILAQETALRDYDEPVELAVRLKPLFGEPDEFYRVVRDEDGTIITHPK
jgi:hypothetical protein